MQEITQNELKKMILFSCERIERDKEQINKINVFPVPDQDTGNNLAATLKGMKEQIEDKDFSSVEELSNSVLEGALTGAQGNAGIIYTGFLAGFLPELGKENTINAVQLGEAFEKGYERAKDSIQNPREGTILDIVEAFALSFKEESKKEKDIVNVFYKSLEQAHIALENTPNKMEILKKAGVVDAGGLGFLMILETYLDILKEQEDISSPKTFSFEKETISPKRFIQIISNRYEVVALLRNVEENEKSIKNKLNYLGNCLDIIQIKSRTKIHIHTDSPYEVRDIIKGIGDIENLKIQDMAREVIGEKSIESVSIGIIIDERAGLTAKIIDHYDIEVIPFKITWPEGESLPGNTVCEKIKEAKKQGLIQKPKIEPISHEFFLEAYKKQLEKFKNVLCVVSSSKLSESYKAALKAKSLLNQKDQEKVFIIDSKNISAGQSLLILEAIELIKEHRNIKEIQTRLEKIIPQINVCFVLEEERWWKGNFWSKEKKDYVHVLAQIKDGKLTKTGPARSKDFANILFKRIDHITAKEIKKGGRIRAVIAHGDNQEQAEQLKSSLKKYKRADISFVTITDPVTSINACPESLIVGWIVK
ncbi:MAG: DegV family protein [Candidatus Pacebacteria bacterium]|nr:DegV family protein [Candidatus Paceibacterota bacterium]MDD5013195.1 DegV family protein [Candidatus Paceibacterota bacterium]MDD5752663.1 DegV family protein [Candidatus Paceibacterota bacterium]